MSHAVIIILLIASSSSFMLFAQDHEQVPYAQLVFPKDVNKKPLLFREIKGLYEQNVIDRCSRYLSDFVYFQKEERGVEHKIIKRHEQIDESGAYRYVVDHRSKIVRSGSVMYESLTFYFTDISTGEEYRDYALSQKTKDLNAPYSEGDIYYVSAKYFFRDLEKTIESLDKVGSQKTYKKALKKQKRSGNSGIWFGVIAFGVVPACCAIGALLFL